MLALDINNVGIASTSAANTVLLWLIPAFPVLILLLSSLLVESCLLQPWLTWQLAGWSVCWAMLDGGVSVTEVTEVVDVLW